MNLFFSQLVLNFFTTFLSQVRICENVATKIVIMLTTKLKLHVNHVVQLVMVLKVKVSA